LLDDFESRRAVEEEMSLHSDLTPVRGVAQRFGLATLERDGSEDEVARLRAALEAIVELLVERGIVDAATLETRLAGLLQPILPVALGTPLPPPQTSDASARSANIKTVPARQVSAAAAKPAPTVTAASHVGGAQARPITPVAPAAAAPAVVVPHPPAASSAPVVARAPVAVAPAPAAGSSPAHVATGEMAQKTHVTTGAHPTLPAPAPARARRSTTPLPEAPAPVAGEPAWTHVSQRPATRTPTPQPLAETPHKSELLEKPRRRDEEIPSLKPKGFFGGLFTRKKKPIATIAAKADKIEFTERMPKLPANDGLYSDNERRTELAFPPPETMRKARSAAPRAKRPPKRVASDGPARFCDRCWRRLDASGVCKTCPSV
jgi:hypothetical protein